MAFPPEHLGEQSVSNSAAGDGWRESGDSTHRVSLSRNQRRAETKLNKRAYVHIKHGIEKSIDILEIIYVLPIHLAEYMHIVVI